MKQRLFYRLVLLFLLSMSLFQCKKDDDSAPFIDGYEPKLTDVKGTAYVGDFFPVDEGCTWTYDNDTLYLNGKLTLTYDDHTEVVTLSSASSVYHKIETGAGKSINIQGTDIFIIPVTDDSITQYYQKTDTSVNVPAYNYGGSTFKFNNPFYLKKTLVAGDKWKADPVINFDKYLESVLGESVVQDFNYSVLKSYIYVFGKDSAKWKRNENNVLISKNIMTVKVEQRSSVTGQATLLLNDTIPGTVNYTAEYSSILNLADTVGIIRSINIIKIRGNGYYLVGDQKVNLGLDYTLTLRSVLNKYGRVKSTSTQSNVYSDIHSKQDSKLFYNRITSEILKRYSQLKN